MSLLSELNNQLIRFPAMRNIPMPRNLQLSVPQKVTVVSVTVGLALLGFLARYFRRKRHAVGCPPEDESSAEFNRGPSRRKDRGSRKASASKGRSPNGEAVRRVLHRQASSSVSAVSVASSTAASGISSVVAAGIPLDVASTLTPQQLGVMGMEALQTAISYWEDALESYGSRGAGGGAAGDAPARPLAVTTAEEAEFSRELHNLLDSAYKLQDECELLFLDQRSVLFREDSSAVREWVTGSRRSAAAGSSAGGSRRGHLSRGDSDRRTYVTGASSSPDSFASAQDELLREIGVSTGWPRLDVCLLYVVFAIFALIAFTVFALFPAVILFLVISYAMQHDPYEE